MKNNLQGNNSRVDEAKNQINDLEHKEAKNNQAEQQKEEIEKNEDSTSSLWDNFTCSNIRIMVPARYWKSTWKNNEKKSLIWWRK